MRRGKILKNMIFHIYFECTAYLKYIFNDSYIFLFYNIKIRKIRDKNRYFIYGCIYGSYKFKVCADVVCV